MNAELIILLVVIAVGVVIWLLWPRLLRAVELIEGHANRTYIWVTLGIVAIVAALLLPMQWVIGPLLLLVGGFIITRSLWRRITWPMIVRQLGDQGIFWVRVPQERWLSIDKDRSLHKSFVSTGQQRREEFRLWCFEKNLKLIGRLSHESTVFINGKEREDYADPIKADPEHGVLADPTHRTTFPVSPMQTCRDAAEELEHNRVTVEQLAELPELRWLSKDIKAELFNPARHRELRKQIFELDSRTYFMLPEGIGGLVPIPPFWIVDIKTVEELPVTDYERKQIAIREQKVKHSVDLRQRVYFFPKEKVDEANTQRQTGLEITAVAREMRIPNQTTNDLVEVAIALSGNFLPVDPEKIAYKVTNSLYASYLLLLGPLGQAVRSLQIRQLILDLAQDEEEARLIAGKPRKRQEGDIKKAIDQGTSQFQIQLKAEYGLGLGQVRRFPTNWNLALKDRPDQIKHALRLFPDGLIPTRDYIKPTKGKENNEESTADDVQLFKVLGFPVTPYLNSAKHVHWQNRYLSEDPPVGVIYNRMGYFTLFDLADVEIDDKNVTEKLQKEWLFRAFEARGRIALAEATKQEQLLDLAGRAAGLEAQFAALKNAEIIGAEAVGLIKYFERNRMLAGLPKEQNLNMFLGEDGTKPLGTEKEQMLFSLLAQSPEMLSKLLKIRDAEMASKSSTAEPAGAETLASSDEPKT